MSGPASRPRFRHRLAVALASALAASAVARAEDPPPPPASGDPPPVLPAPGANTLPPALGDPETVSELLSRLKQLEDEVRGARELKDKVEKLQEELDDLKQDKERKERQEESEEARKKAEAVRQDYGRRVESAREVYEAEARAYELPPFRHLRRDFATILAEELEGWPDLESGSGSGSGGGGSGAGGGGSGGGGGSPSGGEGYRGGAGRGTMSAGGGGGAGPNDGGTSGGPDGGGDGGSVGRGERSGSRDPLDRPLKVEYQYNFAGGYFSLFDEDREFVLNVQNILVTDGTFYDRRNAPTEQKGFNVPFQRLYLYGNITKNWEYQVSEQSTLGTFNLLDLLVNIHYDDRAMLKIGRFLSPFYYQDYATFPMLVPTINYSPLFQFSGQRQVGAMLWGKPFDNRMQYQAGIFNGIPNGYSDFDHNRDFIGSLTFTPFMQSGDERLQNLGFGVSTQVGWQNYLLDDPTRRELPDFPSIAGSGAPELNQRYVTTSGIPFFIYNDNVRALGRQTRVAPHFFWYGRASILSELVFQDRMLADPSHRGNSRQRGFYVQGSYFLTGERNTGDGTGGFPTIIPNRPFNPSRGDYGIGAWEVAAQYTHLNVGTDDIRRGFAAPIWATRLNEVQYGLNWWPNKYVRVSFNVVQDQFNRAIPWPVHGNRQRGTPVNFVDDLTIFWTRIAIFF